MPTATWTIDSAHSGVHFIARHLVITKVRGNFKNFRGTLQLDEADLTKSSVDVTIDTASIDTADEKRDGHLKSADFLESEKFPTISFKSTSIAKAGEGYKVTGDLTLHGVTKAVTLDATYEGKGKDPWGAEKVGFSAKGTLNREDFGVKWNAPLETGGVLIGTKIEIELDIQAVRAK